MRAGGAGPGPGSAASARKDEGIGHDHDHGHARRAGILLLSGGLAGAISRTATAPVDRLKILLQVQESAKPMSIWEGVQKMQKEGTVKAYFRGNGTNVIKIAPETAAKLTLNDIFKHAIARDPEHIHPAERVVSGGLAGALSQFVLYPLDTIRTRLAVCKNGSYNGIYHAFLRIRSEEGLSAFYRGLLPSTIGILPYAGVDIALFEILKVLPSSIGILPYAGLGAWGMFVVGLLPSTIGILPYAGVNIALFEILKTRIRGGLLPTHTPTPDRASERGAPPGSRAPLECSQERLLDEYDGEPPHLAILGTGMLSSSIAQLVSYPLALIRTRLQAQGASGHPIKYTGMVDVARQTVQREGVRGLYKGLLTNLFKLAPAAGISWYVFEETKLLLGVDPRS
ncbi:hypothetical protein FOA52_011539 [Chlamydomonas sp. UWO 241]|nr:hypothetical protein FOA52_011539 [Chlamydomonas sp. UWO 241]